MTVRDAVSVLYDAKQIKLVWNDCGFLLIKDDPVMLDAYGKYIVQSIRGFNNNPDELGESTEYEIALKLVPAME